MFVLRADAAGRARLGPLAAGLALAPMAVAFLAASLLSARLVARFGRRGAHRRRSSRRSAWLLLADGVLAGWPHGRARELAPGMVVAGFGQGMA